MDRNVVIVGAVVAAAVGLFGLNLVSDRALPEDDATASVVGRSSDGRYPSGSSSETGAARGPGSGEHRGAVGHTGRLAGARADADGGHGGSSNDTSGRISRGHGGDRSDAKAAGQGAVAGGSVGVSASSRRGAGATGSSADIASGAQFRSGAGRSVLPHDRSDLVEKLAALPADKSAELPYPAPAEGGEDVVFSLDHVAQAEQSSVTAEGVDAPRDGVGITFADDAQLVFPDAGNAKGDAGSIAFEVEPDWEGGSRENHALVAIHNLDQWANRVEVVKNERYLRYIFTDNTGQERDISLAIDQWQPGERHSVTATWGDSSTMLYVDGRLVGRNTYPGSLELRPGTPLYLGSQAGNFSGAGAKIENFKIYGRALDQSEIQ